MIKGFTDKQGFTLVEILVSIAVLSVIGLLILNIFSRSLRGGNKAQIILAIKQNGQTVLENMDKTIRGADNVVCVNLPGQLEGNTVVLLKNGTYTRYRFVSPTADTNGQIQQDNPVKVIDQDTSLLETDSVFINRACNPSDPMVSGKTSVLTDTNTKTGVSIKDGLFKRDKQAGFRDVVTIQFDAAQGVGVTADTSLTVDPVRFKTTIQLR